MKRLEHETVKVEPFELKLPEPFNIEPAYTVQLPGKAKALIYHFTVKESGWVDRKREQWEVPGWKVIIVNRQGNPHAYFNNSNTFTEPLNLALYLKDVVTRISKTRRSHSVETDVGDE